MSHTRIILVDDHTLFRKGLAELLEQSGSIEVTAFTGNPDEVAMLLKAHRPDVLMLDLNMPGTDGITLMQQLRAAGFDLPVLILTLSEAEDDLARALRAGANGYLLKSMEPDEVVDAILRAQRGETVVAPAMTAKLVKLYDQKGQDANSLLDALTPREREILTHLSRGESNKTIARTLDISHDTVKLHVRHILAKLNLSSRVEAAVFAVEHKVAPGGAATADEAGAAAPDARHVRGFPYINLIWTSLAPGMTCTPPSMSESSAAWMGCTTPFSCCGITTRGCGRPAAGFPARART